ncbi:MAG: hypothetical protein U5K28_11910 [Halobacteriales archaeon]|nr:hypothetical protein [Halobacteriales archaeon]
MGASGLVVTISDGNLAAGDEVAVEYTVTAVNQEGQTHTITGTATSGDTETAIDESAVSTTATDDGTETGGLIPI